MPVVFRSNRGPEPLPRFQCWTEEFQKETGTLPLHGTWQDLGHLPEVGETLAVTLRWKTGQWEHCLGVLATREIPDLDPEERDYAELSGHFQVLGTARVKQDSAGLRDWPICCPRCHTGNDPLDRQCGCGALVS